MKSRHLIAAAAALATLGVAQANEPGANHAGINTRAEVMAEIHSGRTTHDGEALGFAESYGAVVPTTRSETTRSEVTAQVKDARLQHDTMMEQHVRGEAWGEVEVDQLAMNEPMLLEPTGAGVSSFDARDSVATTSDFTPDTSDSAVTVQPGQTSDILSGYASDPSAGAYPNVHTEVTLSSADTMGTSMHDRPQTREEVMAELANARATGELDARGELSGDIGDTKFGNLPQHNIAFVEQAGQQEAQPLAWSDTVRPQGESFDSSSDSVVLWVPEDGEAVTLQPGETMLLVPVDEAPDAE